MESPSDGGKRGEESTIAQSDANELEVSEDGLFGVPTFVYRGETFWGNDRIEWLIRAVRRGAGVPEDDAIEKSLSRFA